MQEQGAKKAKSMTVTPKPQKTPLARPGVPRGAVPAVSVIIATYNWSQVLPYSIGSVLLQTMQDFEIIVVGDGCTDDSAEVVASIGDARISWVNLPVNTGHQSGPNNEGLARARGRIIAYLGHDDLWLPHHLSSIVEAIGDGADFVHSGVLMVKPDDRGQYPLFVRAFRPGTAFPPSGIGYRREVADAVGSWRDYREIESFPDRDRWRRICERGFVMRPVHRLGAIKLAASARKHVYRERPSHEQAAWLERIRTDPALEATELAKFISHRTLRHELRTIVGGWAFKGLRRLKLGLSPKAGSEIELLRRFRGLETHPAGSKSRSTGEPA